MSRDLVFRISLLELAGYTMLHFWWIGTLVWILLIALRRSVRHARPTTRYLFALAAFALLVLSAIGAAGLSASQVRSQMLDQQQSITTAQQYNASLQPAVAQFTPREALLQWFTSEMLNPTVQFLPWLWALGTTLIALLFVTGVCGTVSLRRRSAAIVDPSTLERFNRLKTSLGILSSVSLRACDQLSTPVVVGIIWPTILLPPAILTGLTPDQLEMILLHELAHVQRWDNLVNLIQRVVESLLFYHPAIWWASRWVRLEREHCCDALVLTNHHAPQAYAETLASLAMPELSPQFAVAAMANHQLTSRICQILNVEEQTMTTSRRSFMLIFTLLLLLIAAGYRTAVAVPEPIWQGYTDSETEVGEEAVPIPLQIEDLDSRVFDFYVGFLRSDDDQPSETLVATEDEASAKALEAEDVDTFTIRDRTGFTFHDDFGEEAFVFADGEFDDELSDRTHSKDLNQQERQVIQKMIDRLQERLKQLDDRNAEVSEKRLSTEKKNDFDAAKKQYVEDRKLTIKRMPEREISKDEHPDSRRSDDSPEPESAKDQKPSSAQTIKRRDNVLELRQDGQLFVTEIESPDQENMLIRNGDNLMILRGSRDRVIAEAKKLSAQQVKLVEMQSALQAQQAAIEKLAASLKAMQLELLETGINEERDVKIDPLRLEKRSREDLEEEEDAAIELELDPTRQ